MTYLFSLYIILDKWCLFFPYTNGDSMNIRVLLFTMLMWSTIGLEATPPTFTFNQIAGDKINMGASVECDASGNIMIVNDGKKTPLILGSIPYKKSHIDQLQTFGNKLNRNELIGLITLTEAWENKEAGLYTIIKKNKKITQHQYPTKDCTPPLFIDLLCAVYDLENRDARNETVSLVHCKYGRGRSAMVAAAYIAHVLHAKGITTTPNKIEAYLVARRPLVRLHNNQRIALAFFYDELKKAGCLEALYAQHKEAIGKRRKRINS